MIRPPASMRGAFVLMAVVLALATGTLAGVAMSQPPLPGRGKSESRPPQTATNQPQGATQGNPVPTAAPTTPVTQTAQNSERRESSPDWWMLGLTGLLVIVGGLQVWSVISQNNIMDRQTAVMNGQLKATETAADAAKSSAETASSALRQTQRARVAFDKWEIAPKQSRLHSTVFLVNHGPTVGTIIESNIEHDAGRIADVAEKPTFLSSPQSKSVPVYPSRGMNDNLWVDLNAQAANALNDPKGEQCLLM